MASMLPGRYSLVRHCLQSSALLKSARKSFSNAVNANFRTSEGNPANHTLADVGKFYTIPKKLAFDQIFKFGGWPKLYMEQCKTFGEACLMVRQPGLEIIHYLENADYSKPINKYLLYGRHGNGKSLVMSYIIHYAFMKGWLIVHLPWFARWLSSPKDITMSQTKQGFVDLNARASEWLSHFKLQNLKVLNENEFPVENDYTWNIRESSKAGDSLLSLIDYGILRGSFSSEVVVAIMKEIKLLSKSGKAKTLLLIDGFNAFFHDVTKIKDADKKPVPPRKVSFLNAFFEMAAADWHNGAAVLSVDRLAVKGHNESMLPLYQLTLEGFEYIFPFVPIEVQPFTKTEFNNMLNYYRDRKWLREIRGDLELKYLSCQNGFELMRIVAPL